MGKSSINGQFSMAISFVSSFAQKDVQKCPAFGKIMSTLDDYFYPVYACFIGGIA